ncbi:DUF2589 domain-containing protein [Phaeospirillum tilakii]|uniref:DUF2589 domain-containing protein n=1 Tax=Phaeospirillum tilakii TaxID=741673 RepID=A0ABW5C665_9PROT
MPEFNMGDQFRGLPMGDLIGAPLSAACEAQVRLATATANFINVVGFLPPKNDNDPLQVRTVAFRFDRASRSTPPDIKASDIPQETVNLEVPLLALVKIPSLAINKVDITFDMEVKNAQASSEGSTSQAALDAQAKVGWGPFSVSVKITGSVSSHKENTRSTDQTAKYHVEVHAVDDGMPEGLARVLDLIAQSVAPKKITSVNASAATPAVGTGTP